MHTCHNLPWDCSSTSCNHVRVHDPLALATASARHVHPALDVDAVRSRNADGSWLLRVPTCRLPTVHSTSYCTQYVLLYTVRPGRRGQTASLSLILFEIERHAKATHPCCGVSCYWIVDGCATDKGVPNGPLSMVLIQDNSTGDRNPHAALTRR
jgi:hypothetical protein